ncbi:MFS transporter [Streptomyces sp. NBC_00554]|uniref:MFS transporter n=1 Tax=unclassified Streptomyces TaxID=2593676 RepID=UPI00324E3615|nr:MHS family MFS transporter [Streptomyces sp. NBC_00564]WUC54692.1 MHS family MFS transporter [Streptomyces sp. NBC_00554]
MTARSLDDASESKTPPSGHRKAALAAWIGSALEYYDFFIYGSAAALVFPKVFFDPDDPATATLISMATFGVAYAARPIGAVFLGHFGDRIGRRKIMVFTLFLMGLSTFLIGCLPTYGQVGTLAPVLLVVLRFLQGLSAAGEQSSASSLTLEHAPENQRGYFTSFTLNGTQFGLIISTLVFIPIASLPENQLLTWGWRIPFLLSAFVTLAAYFIRRNLQEAPAFEEISERAEVAKLPVVELLRDHWADMLRVASAALIAAVSTIGGVWVLSYSTGAVGLDRTTMLWVSVFANLVALIALPMWAKLSDRIGRKPVFLIGSIGSAVMIFVYLAAVTSKSYPLIFLAGAATMGLVYSASNGIWPSLYAEMFNTRVRLSGMAISTQCGFAITGFAVTYAAQLSGSDGKNWVAVGILTASMCAVSSIAVLTARETYNVPTAELGMKPGMRQAQAAERESAESTAV